MECSDPRYQAYVEILKEELIPAMGCTEPIAIAYAGALARKVLGAMPQKVNVACSGNIVKNVEFTRGCNGNLKAISKLVDGMTVDQIYNTLHGNTCGFKDTSCADQLAQAVRQCYEESQK